MKLALTALRWTLGIVILIEAILFVMPTARHGFAQTHMPDALRLVLGWGEIIGSLLMLIPRTVVRGAWVLAAVFGLAILTHLLHGVYNVGNLLVYIASTWVIAAGRD
jgi:hypothetical protein